MKRTLTALSIICLILASCKKDCQEYAEDKAINTEYTAPMDGTITVSNTTCSTATIYVSNGVKQTVPINGATTVQVKEGRKWHVSAQCFDWALKVRIQYTCD